MSYSDRHHTDDPPLCPLCLRPKPVRIKSVLCRKCGSLERFAATLPERFWARVPKGDGCRLWQGHVMNKGYGVLNVRGKPALAHRVAWTLTHGEIPAGLNVLHRCDTPACVNPDHLFLGTQADNVADMMAKGRDRKRWKTVCFRGHALTPENRRGGRGQCLKCRHIYNVTTAARLRVPCTQCGALRSRPNPKTNTGLCVTCYRASTARVA